MPICSKIATALFAISFGFANAQETQPTPPAPAPLPKDNPVVFEKRIPADELTGFAHFADTPSGEVYKDKEFHKLLKDFVPSCMYHYGRDMPLTDALDLVLKGSPAPAILRDNRYLILIGHNGPYLHGRGFLWVDLQEGIGLGAFFFNPTNGEPTPTLSVFSRQVKEETMRMGQLPPAFIADLTQWVLQSGLPPITTRYFLTGSNRRILLEHDEDYCNPPMGTPCDQMNADAADIDMTAAYYLEQVHYATNATAWMIGPDQVAWVQLRNNTCMAGPNPLFCRIRMTRERTHMIINRRPRHV